MVDLLMLACVVFAFGIVSRRLEGTIITAPIVFVLAGVLLGPSGFGVVELGIEDHAVLLLGEIALAFVLFTAAARTDLSTLRRNRAFPLRLLAMIVVAEAPRLTGRDEIEMVVASTVLLSVLLHGVTAAALSAAYARRVQRMAHDAPEKQETLEASRRRESTSTQAPSA